MISIKYPFNVNSNADRYVYLYRLQELLRFKHNAEGKKYSDGDITLSQWNEYKSLDFDPKSLLISNEICKYRELLKSDVKSSAKLSDIQG
jgi:hypothetical protein